MKITIGSFKKNKVNYHKKIFRVPKDTDKVYVEHNVDRNCERIDCINDTALEQVLNIIPYKEKMCTKCGHNSFTAFGDYCNECVELSYLGMLFEEIQFFVSCSQNEGKKINTSVIDKYTHNFGVNNDDGAIIYGLKRHIFKK